MFSKLKEMDFKNKRVMIRVDFNVPLADKVVRDDSRIRKTLPTIKHILSKKPAQIILISHLGRPNGEYNPEFTLKPVCDKLQELLGNPVYFETNPRINNINAVAMEKIVMLENLRFEKFEEDNDDAFAQKLASFADVFVLEAFSVAHREHASVVGIPKYLPSCPGLLLEKEIEMLRDNMQDPDRPFVAIIAGAKGDKIDAINALLQKVDILIIGGALANTFLAAKGVHIGHSKYSQEHLEYAKQVLVQYQKKIALPVDYIIADKFDANAQTKVAGLKDNIDGWMILDIGPYTISGYEDIVNKAKTVVWAGPIGVFEWEKFRRGTWDLARTIAERNCTKIIGGGDSAAAIRLFKLEDKMTHVSTGGGASLALLSGKELPGIKALEDNFEKYKK